MAVRPTPYDTFFRQAFSTPGAALELTRLAAPEFAEQFAGAIVTVERDSLVPAELRSRHTDLLVRFDQKKRHAYAFVLYEHKSYPDRWVSLQLLRYLVIIWSREQKRGGKAAKHLPPIMPIVLYHGARPWNEPREFSELVAGIPAEHVPHFRPVFMDLATVPAEQVAGSLRFMLGLLSLKYVRHAIEDTVARRLVSLFDAGRRDPEVSDLARLAEQMYVQTRSREDIEYLTAIAGEAHYEVAEEDLMTYAEELLKEGMEKGELREKRAVLARLLTRRFTLTDAERDRITSCGRPDALDAALDEFVVATEKQQVLSKLTN
jgi:predicted transposase/invertase (TIGR01784 family)